MLGKHGFAEGRIGEGAIGHGSFDDGRANGVDANFGGGAFESGCFREAEHAVFAGDIDACPRKTLNAGDGRHVDDGAAFALLDHLLNFVFEAEPESFQIDVVDVVPVFFGLIDERNPDAFDAGVVEGDVEAAEFLDGFLNHCLDIGRFRNVGFQEESIASCGADETESFVAFGFAAACKHDLGAALCEEDGGVAADAGGAAGDESYFVFEILAHDFSCSEIGAANCSSKRL